MPKSDAILLQNLVQVMDCYNTDDQYFNSFTNFYSNISLKAAVHVYFSVTIICRIMIIVHLDFLFPLLLNLPEQY